MLLDDTYPRLDVDLRRSDARGRFYKLFADGEVASAEDEESQAK